MSPHRSGHHHKVCFREGNPRASMSARGRLHAMVDRREADIYPKGDISDASNRPTPDFVVRKLRAQDVLEPGGVEPTHWSFVITPFPTDRFY